MFDDTEMLQEQEVPETEQQEQAPEQAPEPVKLSNKEENFRALRQQKEQLQRERDEAFKRLQELEAKASNADDFEVNLGEDELAEGKHLRKVSGKIRKLEEQLAAYAQATQAVSVETRLRQQYPDIDQVVTEDTVQQLKSQYPELAATLSASGDHYNKAAAAYTMIKKLGIVPERQQSHERERATANFNKPRPMASISPGQGDSPLSHANAFAHGLTDELKSQLHKEMLEAIRNR